LVKKATELAYGSQVWVVGGMGWIRIRRTRSLSFAAGFAAVFTSFRSRVAYRL